MLFSGIWDNIVPIENDKITIRAIVINPTMAKNVDHFAISSKNLLACWFNSTIYSLWYNDIISKSKLFFKRALMN